MTPDGLRAERRREWLAWRRDGIGASDIAAMVHGIYGGTYAVVADKLGYDTDLGDNQAAKDRGLAWEQRIADAVQALTGLYVVGEQAPMVHPEHAHHRCSADGFLSAIPNATRADLAAGLEIKTVGEWADMHWGRWETQTRWQMHVCDVDRVLIAAAKMGTDDDGNDTVDALLHRWIHRDHELEAELVGIADRAWALVQAGALPTPDCGSAIDYVRKVTAIADMSKDPPAIDLDPIADHLARFALIKDAEKRATEERKRLYAVIASVLGPNRVGVTADGYRVTYSAPQREVDTDTALADHPDYGRVVFDRARFETDHGTEALEQYKHPTGPRTLTVKPPKDTRK